MSVEILSTVAQLYKKTVGNGMACREGPWR